MKYLLTIISIIVINQFLFADDIYFKSGYIFKNVMVKDTIDRRINVVIEDSLKSFPLSTVYQIVKRPYDSTSKMVIENFSPPKTMNDITEGNDIPWKKDIPEKLNVKYEYRNMKFLPVAGVAFVLSYYNYKWSNTSDKDAKIFHVAMGTFFLLAGIADVWISLTPVEISGTSESLSLIIYF